MKSFSLLSCLLLIVCMMGCYGTLGGVHGDVGYPVPVAEAQWIRDGEPLIFEGESWHPKDDVDVLTDNDVYLLGEYKGVQFFIEKVDVRPYHRLYTKFDKNRFRVFMKQRND